jgi:POT family proton-dependent oligopeptide transporter
MKRILITGGMKCVLIIVGMKCVLVMRGMKCILVVFMTSHLRDAQRQPAYLSEKVALVYYHSFTSAVYLTPLGGALLAEAVLGKYRTVVYLSLVYCGGHLALAIDETRTGDGR